MGAGGELVILSAEVEFECMFPMIAGQIVALKRALRGDSVMMDD